MIISVILRKSTLPAQKVWHWAGPSRRCWTSALCPRLPLSERDTGRVRPPAVLSFVRTALLQRNPLSAAPFLVRNQHFHSSAVRQKKRQKVEPPRELDLLRYDMNYLWKSPKPALYLGFGGLIPFITPTLFMAMTESYYPELAYAQLAYSASIVSFLGGARWGFALPESSPAKPDWINLANSVVPTLIASIAMLMSDSIAPGITMIIMGLGISLHYDLSLLPTYPSWLKALRAILTFVAFFSLIGNLIIYAIYPEKKLLPD